MKTFSLLEFRNSDNSTTNIVASDIVKKTDIELIDYYRASGTGPLPELDIYSKDTYDKNKLKVYSSVVTDFEGLCIYKLTVGDEYIIFGLGGTYPEYAIALDINAFTFITDNTLFIFVLK